MEAFLQIIIVLAGIAYAVAFVESVIWAARDAEDRSKSGCLVALLIILMPWPIGLIAWLVFRPESRESEGSPGPAPPPNTSD